MLKLLRRRKKKNLFFHERAFCGKIENEVEVTLKCAQETGKNKSLCLRKFSLLIFIKFVSEPTKLNEVSGENFNNLKRILEKSLFS